MVSRKLTVLSLLLVLPVVASAQRSRSSFGRDEQPKWDELGKGSGGLQLSNRDVENISPLKLVIDKRKDLKVTDDQLKQLKDLDAKLKDQNQALFKMLDSLRKEAQASARGGEEDRPRMMSARREVMGVVRDIRANYDASLKEAMSLFDDTQRTTADGLVQKQKEEAEKMLSEKLGGRPGGEGGAEGRRGRPPVD